MTLALDHAAFDAALHDLRDATTGLEQVRDHTSSRVDALVEAGWTGLAAVSFADAWSDWRRAADDVLAGLVMIAELLDATRDDLDARDLDAQSSLGRVATRLQARLG